MYCASSDSYLNIPAIITAAEMLMQFTQAMAFFQKMPSLCRKLGFHIYWPSPRTYSFNKVSAIVAMKKAGVPTVLTML